jgi:hypothetical protein
MNTKYISHIHTTSPFPCFLSPTIVTHSQKNLFSILQFLVYIDSTRRGHLDISDMYMSYFNQIDSHY